MTQLEKGKGLLRVLSAAALNLADARSRISGLLIHDAAIGRIACAADDCLLDVDARLNALLIELLAALEEATRRS